MRARTVFAWLIAVGLAASGCGVADRGLSWVGLKDKPEAEQPAEPGTKPAGMWIEVLSEELKGIELPPGGPGSRIRGLGIGRLVTDSLMTVVVGFPADRLVGRHPTRFQLEFVGSAGDSIVTDAVAWEIARDDYQATFKVPWTGSQAQLDLLSNGAFDRYFGHLSVWATGPHFGLTVSANKAGGRRGQGEAPYVAVDRRITIVMRQSSNESAVYETIEPVDSSFAAASKVEMKMEYDERTLSIHNIDLVRNMSQGGNFTIERTGPGSLRAEVTSDEPTREVPLFGFLVTPTLALERNSTTTILFHFTFSNKEQAVGTQTARWVIDMAGE